jgi:hypothetical protein
MPRPTPFVASYFLKEQLALVGVITNKLSPLAASYFLRTTV